MKKIKFKVRGMHCNSCSGLIEGALKEQEGVVSSKVNLESEKAVVVFDENKTKEDDIKRAIESAGDYQAEQINDTDKAEIGGGQNKEENSKGSFLSGLFAGAAVMAVIAFVIVPGLSSDKSTKEPTDLTAQVEDSDAYEEEYEEEYEYEEKVDVKVAQGDHIRGNANAPVTIVEFSDFQCPYCSRFHDTMSEVMENYPNEVRWVYKHFPLDSIHPAAREAAEASECAGEQNKFWEYNDELFDNQSKIKSSYFPKAAEVVGLNIKQFNECLDSGKYADKVEEDYQEGIKLGVRGTPGGFINGEEIGGAQPYSVLSEMIDSLL